MIKNVLTLNESTDGNRIKQGDQSVMRYTLSDTNNDNLGLDGKQAIVYLYTDKGVAYKQETTVSNNVVDVVIDEIIPTGHYTLEIVVDNKYIFPSDNKTKIEVTSSVLGKSATSIKPVNMFNELLDEAIKSGKLDGLKGSSETISDEHIIDVMQNDFLEGKGQLGYILIENPHITVPISLIMLYDTSKTDTEIGSDPVSFKTLWESLLDGYISYNLEGQRKQFKLDGFIKYVEGIGYTLPPKLDLYAKVTLDDGQVFVYPDTTSLNNNIDITGTIIDELGTVVVSYKFNDKLIDKYKLEIGSHS